MSQSFELKDILILARQEAQRMRHFYLGVEHLFIALIEVEGGITRQLLSEQGISADYVAEAIRRKVGKGSKHRLWAGIPNTPRTDVVLGIADEIMRENNRSNLSDRDILVAILDERDSVPLRVLENLAIPVDELRTKTLEMHTIHTAHRAFVSVEFAPSFAQELDSDTLFILRRAFYGYDKVRVESRLLGGYSASQLYIVTPLYADNRADASVVVKIAPSDLIQDEAQRYERFVQRTLPPLTARLEEKPTIPEGLGIGLLKYTLIANGAKPTDMRHIIPTWTEKEIADWLNNALFEGFGAHWWRQNRPYRFEAWQEYDSMLPPLLTLELQKSDNTPPEAHTLKFPVKRTRLHKIQYGEVVVLENFLVQKINMEQQSIVLAIGNSNGENRALHIEVRGIDFNEDMYYRGEVVERIVGRVWQTRDELLQQFIKALSPDFAPSKAEIPYVNERTLPNTLTHYHQLLDTTINSTISIIHGDLHLGNILLSPSKQALLIDFAHTREGHTLFDWATLELSFINQWLGDQIGETWQDIRQISFALSAIYRNDINPNTTLYPLLKSIESIRQIAAKSFSKVSNWHEYHMTLVFLCLRAFTWETLPIANRRLMLYWGALALQQVLQHQRLEGIPASDATDFPHNSSLL